MEKNIIKIKDLSFAYQEGKDVIKNLSLNIKDSTYTVILGHNGSGKSTLAKLLLGLIDAQSGQILVDDKILNNENVYAIRDLIGIVFQNPDNQFIGATVADDIAFGLENHCVESEKMQAIIEEFAKKVNMIDYLDKEPTHLSGGQKQRVAIAGVLAMSPRILIFDEATSMLDPKGKKEIKELINKTKEIYPSIAIISITHDIEEALNADEVVILNQGKIYMQGKPNEVFNHEEKLKAINLDVPFACKLKNALVKENIKVEKNDIEGMVKDLCQ